MSLDERSFDIDIAGNLTKDGSISFGNDNDVAGKVGAGDTDWYQLHTDIASRHSVVMKRPGREQF